MTPKKTFVDYFSFSRQNRIAIIVLLLIAGGVYIFPFVVSRKSGTEPVKTDTAWFAAVQRLALKNQEKWNTQKDNSPKSTSFYQYDKDADKPAFQKFKGELFYFDPNTLSASGWQRLGLRDKTIQTIQNYISKGGRFRKPEDLRRIYGLFEDEYDRLAPYIKIEPDTSRKANRPYVKTKTIYPDRYQPIKINSADSIGFQSLPGIGPYYARSIIRFRERLGGFYSVDQIAETYRLPDSTFQKIKKYLILDTVPLRKININTATKEQLKAHPYILWNKAKVIFNYREQHGPFQKIEDLKKIMILTNDWYNKILPYLKLDDSK